MDILMGCSILLLLCIALLALAIWFRTSKENQAFLNVMSRLMEVEKIARECQTLVNSHNTTVARVSLGFKDIEQEVLKYQDHCSKQNQELTRLANMIAWKRPVIRVEEMSKRKKTQKEAKAFV